MTIYSQRYNIPMPEDGDPIYKGAEQMRDLASTVDQVLGEVADASALDATSAATPGRIIQRDGLGRARVANPVHTQDIANLGTVTDRVGAVSTRLGGLKFQVLNSAPPAGTPSTTITFVRP